MSFCLSVESTDGGNEYYLQALIGDPQEYINARDPQARQRVGDNRIPSLDVQGWGTCTLINMSLSLDCMQQLLGLICNVLFC